MYWLAALLAFAGPFWEEKPPAEWTDIQISQFLSDSPWAHMAGQVAGRAPQGPPVTAILASAAPVRSAEAERERRRSLRTKQPAGALEEEYRAWLEEMRTAHIVLALRVPAAPAFSDQAELRRMEEGCWMRLDRRRVKMIAYFPPSARSPFLRLAFPRSALGPEEKAFGFDLYVPGIAGPYRQVDFDIRSLTVAGKPEI